ncbi:MAG: hypothetical protein ACK5B6_08810 [Bacteroidia bacterium]|jgi:hypothetical protein
MMIRGILFLFLFAPLYIHSQSDAYDWQLWSGFSIENNDINRLDLGLSYQNRLDRAISRVRGHYTTLDASYKWRKKVRLLAAVRFASSERWDKLRLSLGATQSFELLSGTTIKFRGLWQIQAYPGSEIRYGINVPQQNYRFRFSLRQKILKKTWLNLHTEPLWRAEPGILEFNRIRSSVQLERALPGPWSLTLGYLRQNGFNRGANMQAIVFEVQYFFKLRKKRCLLLDITI